MNFPEVLLTRRSIRRYRQLPVPDEDLRFLLEAARLAACATNRQILRFIVARTPGQVAALLPLTAWAALVSPRRSPQLDISAPAAFIAVTAPDGVTPELTPAQPSSPCSSPPWNAAWEVAGLAPSSGKKSPKSCNSPPTKRSSTSSP